MVSGIYVVYMLYILFNVFAGCTTGTIVCSSMAVASAMMVSAAGLLGAKVCICSGCTGQSPVKSVYLRCANGANGRRQRQVPTAGANAGANGTNMCQPTVDQTVEP